jgi:hypothetical protein
MDTSVIFSPHGWLASQYFSDTPHNHMKPINGLLSAGSTPEK